MTTLMKRNRTILQPNRNEAMVETTQTNNPRIKIPQIANAKTKANVLPFNKARKYTAIVIRFTSVRDASNRLSKYRIKNSFLSLSTFTTTNTFIMNLKNKTCFLLPFICVLNLRTFKTNRKTNNSKILSLFS